MPRQTRVIIQELDRVTANAVRDLSTDLTDVLRTTTPVDTGWARANWVPQAGSPFEGNTEELDPGERFLRTPAQEASQATAIAALSSYRGGEVFINNNVPYITELNEGSSQQAPAGFVQMAIAAVVQLMQRRRLR